MYEIIARELSYMCVATLWHTRKLLPMAPCWHVVSPPWFAQVVWDKQPPGPQRGPCNKATCWPTQAHPWPPCGLQPLLFGGGVKSLITLEFVDSR